MLIKPIRCIRCNKLIDNVKNSNECWCLSCRGKIKERMKNKQCIICGDALTIPGGFKCSLCRVDETDQELAQKRIKIEFK